MEKTLTDMKEWAKAKIASGQEPPWAWYQYMKLIETIDAILESMGATKENLQQSGPHQDARLRLVDSTYPRDSAQHHPGIGPVPLPM